MDKKISGIYKILCLSNNKIYIGSSNNIYKRWYQHRNALNKGNHTNQHLQRAWLKYGEENFIFSILEECQDENLLEREQYYIDLYDVCNRNKGFNIALNAESPMKGRKHSQETKKHLSDIRKGTLCGKNNPMYGKHLTDEQKLNLSIKWSGENNPFYGRKHSEETKERISKANRGKIRTEEYKKQLSKRNSGSNNPSARKVYVYDDEYILIKVFETVNECGLWLLENNYVSTSSNNPLPILRSSISKSIKKNKKYGGFNLSYEPKEVA